MPWWFWVLLWGSLLLASVVGLVLVCWRVFRSGLALLREVGRAAATVSIAPGSAPDGSAAAPNEADDGAVVSRELA
ncbi:hypothetical protein BKD30_02155 [Tersicoccus phoenicis]|uniref:Histidine kinase n=1 Tax=Tersicoccus phoenicis TaxID=554083 RepID=A0A1R1LKZ5_9MICC|nr:hypothetical protein [Tersicoccus phoenicis]OMH28159.1 hypothetical protein BKD30_02155 [Tersicoccus phoenicis]